MLVVSNLTYFRSYYESQIPTSPVDGLELREGSNEEEEDEEEVEPVVPATSSPPPPSEET